MRSSALARAEGSVAPKQGPSRALMRSLPFSGKSSHSPGESRKNRPFVQLQLLADSQCWHRRLQGQREVKGVV
jgi:hypothetical protein